MVEKYNELVGKLKCYIDKLFLDNHIKDDQIKRYLIEFGLFHNADLRPQPKIK